MKEDEALFLASQKAAKETRPRGGSYETQADARAA
jgi:hypothetical protein